MRIWYIFKEKGESMKSWKVVVLLFVSAVFFIGCGKDSETKEFSASFKVESSAGSVNVSAERAWEQDEDKEKLSSLLWADLKRMTCGISSQDSWDYWEISQDEPMYFDMEENKEYSISCDFESNISNAYFHAREVFYTGNYNDVDISLYMELISLNLDNLNIKLSEDTSEIRYVAVVNNGYARTSDYVVDYSSKNVKLQDVWVEANNLENMFIVVSYFSEVHAEYIEEIFPITAELLYKVVTNQEYTFQSIVNIESNAYTIYLLTKGFEFNGKNNYFEVSFDSNYTVNIYNYDTWESSESSYIEGDILSIQENFNGYVRITPVFEDDDIFALLEDLVESDSTEEWYDKTIKAPIYGAFSLFYFSKTRSFI